MEPRERNGSMKAGAAEAREYLLGLGLAEEDIATLLEKRFQSP